jgi:hypothetical protein
MKMTLSAALTVLALCVAGPHSPVRAEDRSLVVQSPTAELKIVQGTWEGSEAGRSGERACKLMIKGDSVRFEGATRNERYAGTLTQPAGRGPKELHAVESSAQ